MQPKSKSFRNMSLNNEDIFDENQKLFILNTSTNEDSRQTTLINSQVEETNETGPERRIDKWSEILQKFSIFGTRFGIYIGNSTLYVNKCSVFSSIILIVISAIVLYKNFFQISTVSFCCNVIFE